MKRITIVPATVGEAWKGWKALDERGVVLWAHDQDALIEEVRRAYPDAEIIVDVPSRLWG